MLILIINDAIDINNNNIDNNDELPQAWDGALELSAFQQASGPLAPTRHLQSVLVLNPDDARSKPQTTLALWPNPAWACSRSPNRDNYKDVICFVFSG